MKKFVLIPILSMLLTNFITIFSSQLDSNEDEQKSIASGKINGNGSING